MDQNKHGLSRYVPSVVEREVRRRCGFGCVFDGKMIVQNDHFDPEFVDCREHNPNGIALLCGSCHHEKTKGLITNDDVKKAADDPAALRDGFSHHHQRMSGPLTVRIGELTAIEPRSIIQVLMVNLLEVKPPRAEGEPYTVSAKFFDTTGRPILSIKNNLVRVNADNWDVAQVKNRITIRRASGDIALELQFNPPSEVVVNQLKLWYRGFRLEHQPNQETVIEYRGQRFELGAVEFVRPQAAIVAGLSEFTLGVNAESITLRSLRVNPA